MPSGGDPYYMFYLDTLRLRFVHYSLLPLVLFLQAIRRVYPIRMSTACVYATPKYIQRYIGVGFIRFPTRWLSPLRRLYCKRP